MGFGEPGIAWSLRAARWVMFGTPCPFTAWDVVSCMSYVVTGLLPPTFCLYPINSIHRYRTPGLGFPGLSPTPWDGPGCSRARQGPRAVSHIR
jgi:hypothetical protein